MNYDAMRIDSETKNLLKILKKQFSQELGVNVSYGVITKKAIKKMYDEMVVRVIV